MKIKMKMKRVLSFRTGIVTLVDNAYRRSLSGSSPVENACLKWLIWREVKRTQGGVLPLDFVAGSTLGIE